MYLQSIVLWKGELLAKFIAEATAVTMRSFVHHVVYDLYSLFKLNCVSLDVYTITTIMVYLLSIKNRNAYEGTLSIIVEQVTL